MADRKKAVKFAGYQFQHCLAVAGIGSNAANGMTRTLYSLRHTCITFRLLYGKRIDLITLARNARTSVEMIERFVQLERRDEHRSAARQTGLT